MAKRSPLGMLGQKVNVNKNEKLLKMNLKILLIFSAKMNAMDY